MKSRRERMADMAEKVGVVFLAASFLQSDHAGEAVLYFALGVVFLVASVRLSGSD